MYAPYTLLHKDIHLFHRYCQKNYDADKEESSDVYLSLIRMYLHPPDLREYGVPRPEQNVDAALRVIACHHHHVNTAEVGAILKPYPRPYFQFLSVVC